MDWIVFGALTAVGAVVAWELAVKKFVVTVYTTFKARLP